MKKTLKMMAMAIVALSLTFAACTKEDEPNTPGGNNDTPGNNEGTSTIQCVDLESSPVTVSEYSINLMGGAEEFMLENYGEEEAMIAMFEAGAGVVATPTDYHCLVTPLEANATIGSSSNFVCTTSDPQFGTLYANNDYSDPYTAWAGKTAYVGFCFKNAGQTHYGWIKLQVIGNGSECTIKCLGYAFEKTAGKAIKAGAKK